MDRQCESYESLPLIPIMEQVAVHFILRTFSHRAQNVTVRQLFESCKMPLATKQEALLQSKVLHKTLPTRQAFYSVQIIWPTLLFWISCEVNTHRRTLQGSNFSLFYSKLTYSNVKCSLNCCALAVSASSVQQAVKHLVWLGSPQANGESSCTGLNKSTVSWIKMYSIIARAPSGDKGRRV